MALYLVRLNSDTAQRFNSADSIIVSANSQDEAKRLAQANRSNDSNAAWYNATAVELTGTFQGWVFDVSIDALGTFTYEGDNNDRTMADIATALAAEADNAWAAQGNYDAEANLLTFAAANSGHGAYDLVITITPPSGLFPSDYTFEIEMFTDIVDGGDPADAITAVPVLEVVPPSRCMEVTFRQLTQ